MLDHIPFNTPEEMLNWLIDMHPTHYLVLPNVHNEDAPDYTNLFTLLQEKFPEGDALKEAKKLINAESPNHSVVLCENASKDEWHYFDEHYWQYEHGNNSERDKTDLWYSKEVDTVIFPPIKDPDEDLPKKQINLASVFA